jgi:hypothetical protein
VTPGARRELLPAVPRTSSRVIEIFSSIDWSASSTTRAVISLVMEAIGAATCSLRAASTFACDSSKM